MNKPTPKQRTPVMDYLEMIRFVEEKYGITVRDYAGRFAVFPKQVEQYNPTAPPELRVDGNTRYDSEAYQRFERWREENKLPTPDTIPYLDYWHWLLNNHFFEVHNGEVVYWHVQEILDTEDAPVWVKEITQRIHDEFKEQLDEAGGLEVLIEW
ncbi:hypothetical protein HYS49_02595 [Candidatus Woesearchaeota archaeon]|nr:hypothetical protein [Candidatus Woesearchaeota archaeon]